MSSGRGPEVAVGEGGLLAHGWLLDWIVRFASPSVAPVPVLQSCLTRTVLAPERFRGGVAPSALRSRVVHTRAKTLPCGIVSAPTLTRLHRCTHIDSGTR